ncbi:MAG TPA: pyruvate kinase [Patescibacteria group bacterium]|nr:pyruvate kinase [Patescibacteria group bacterium]
MSKTKIVATIGPASDSSEMIQTLIKTGVNIFRFNMKHADKAWHDERIPRVREAATAAGMPVEILIDLQGPEIRLETFNKAEVTVAKGQTLVFSLHPDSEGKNIVLPTPEVFPAMSVGLHLLIDDGAMEFEITQVSPDNFSVTALQDCVIKHRKSVNFPGADIKLPSLTDDDYQKLELTNIKQVDYIALSFTRNRSDVDILRSEMNKRSLTSKICAKIENQMAMDNLGEIVDASDIIMVARGDLAVETPLERLGVYQKKIIATCHEKQKPVITATQMLQSMVKNRRPTRAEISDVANAVYDHTDYCMLSEETAAGANPVLVVETMAKIIAYTESAL